MQIGTGKETTIQSTRKHGLKTDPKMCPQSQVTMDSFADVPVPARHGANRDAGCQAVRAEPGSDRRHRGRSEDSESGAGRAFVFAMLGDPVMPRHPMRVWELPGNGHAVMPRLHHVTVKRREGIGGETQLVEIKIDPGAGRAVLPVSGLSDERGKFSRTTLDLPKARSVDAVRAGKAPMEQGRRRPVLDIRATGREPHGKMNVNRFRLPVGPLMARKSVRGVRKGDIVKATTSSGKRQGVRVPVSRCRPPVPSTSWLPAAPFTASHTGIAASSGEATCTTRYGKRRQKRCTEL